MVKPSCCNQHMENKRVFSKKGKRFIEWVCRHCGKTRKLPA